MKMSIAVTAGGNLSAGLRGYGGASMGDGLLDQGCGCFHTGSELIPQKKTTHPEVFLHLII